MTTGVVQDRLRIVTRKCPFGLITFENRKFTWTRPVWPTWMRNAREVLAPWGRVNPVSLLAANAAIGRASAAVVTASMINRRMLPLLARDENGCCQRRSGATQSPAFDD